MTMEETLSSGLDVIAAGIQHSAWLCMAIVAAVICAELGRRARPLILKSILGVAAFSLALSGTLAVLVWMDARHQITAPFRALSSWQAEGLDKSNLSRRSVPGSVLVLNAPNAIVLNSAVPAFSSESESVDPANLAPYANITYAQMIEGDIGAPGIVNGFQAQYDTKLKLTRAQMVEQVTQHDLVILAGGSADGFQAHVVAEHLRDIDHSPDQFLARFESGDNVVLLQAAAACQAGDFFKPAIITQNALQVVTGPFTTAKLFRQAWSTAAQDKVGSNDASLFGGLIELNELPVGQTYNDIGLIKNLTRPQADRVLVGIYDWQTGERWLALKPDGSQWPDNAVAVDVQSACPR